MANEFIIKCENCQTKASVSGYVSIGNINGSLVSVGVNFLDDNDPEDVEVELKCDKCGNQVYIR